MGIHLTMEQVMEIIPVLAPIVILQAALLILSLVSILRKEAATDRKILWILIVIFISLVGPVIYFAFGSKQLDEDASNRRG